MKNIVIIVLLIVIATLIGYKARAGYVQDLAWQQKIAEMGSYGEVSRIEWYGDVCYSIRLGQGVAISCVKK